MRAHMIAHTLLPGFIVFEVFVSVAAIATVTVTADSHILLYSILYFVPSMFCAMLISIRSHSDTPIFSVG